ncbi:MAG: TVP38/TMEM64 family protein [Promethearchaeota archaeon]|nr:MAG: TVP38/TMEM64 family protein [Candidatus Lokiarchaeota archaeon]
MKNDSSENSDSHLSVHTDEGFDTYIDEFAKPRASKIKIPFKLRLKNAFTGLNWKTWFWFSIIMFVAALTVFAMIQLIRDSSWMFGLVIRYFITPIVELAGWGIVLYFVFMMIQGVIAPLPSEVMLLATGLIWGMWIGSIMAQAGLLAAAVLSYEIGLRGGKPVAEKFIGDDLYVIDYYMMKYGNPTLLITRAIPAISYDPISFAAGFLGIKRRDYYFTTFFGSIPRSLFFAFIGAQLRPEDGDILTVLKNAELLNEFIKAGSAKFNTIVIWAAIIIGVGFVIYKFWLAKYLKWKRVQTEISELNEEGHLDEYGFSQHTMKALISGEIPASAHEIMGFFTKTDEKGKIMLKETIDVMSKLILTRVIPEEMDDPEIHYPHAPEGDRLWLRLAKNYRLLLHDVFKSKNADMIAHMLEGIGHCYYKLGDKKDAGRLFKKSKIIYYQAGEQLEAKRVDAFLQSHFSIKT